ncbi:hypothetical protein NDU88_011519 [Pleurodeles waltl]|uniref:Uncharacterized protein n=1 Tax=Pleurodeles waltl TaxID=8319 RepID=A0AAV7S4I0_PLEWA|nr:hypothetical protein NDU88_011498 [Pleurodeles waltl]KAJ1158846.1 hypothetical protein NDU88_011519 [Pleurodeles waltl]
MLLRDTAEDLQGARALLESFAKVSRLQENWLRTKLFPTGPPLDLEVELHCLPYLGVKIYHSPIDMFNGNYGMARQSLKLTVAFWQALLLSAAGRVPLLKMLALGAWSGQEHGWPFDLCDLRADGHAVEEAAFPGIRRPAVETQGHL